METKRHKRQTIGRIAAIVLVIAAMLVFGGCSGSSHGDSEVKHFGFSTEAAPDSITLKWKKQEDVDHYEIYRVDITEGNYREDETLLKLEDYETVATLNGDSRSYQDTDVESGHTYAYVVSGFRENSGDAEQVCTSFIEDSITYETAGLAKPALLNNGEGENHENSADELYLYCEFYEGMEPDGVELYRKGSNNSDYTQIDFKTLDSVREILDDTVTPGEIYTYRAKTYAERDGQRYYSPFSDEVTIPAVNLVAEYDVETIDSTDDTLIIKVTSAGANGITTFDNSMPARYTLKKDSKSKGQCFSAALTGWNKTNAADDQWQDVSKNGVSIKAGESVCLKYKLSPWKDSDVEFDDVESLLFMDETEAGGAKYDGSGSGTTIMSLDLLAGKGRAYCDWDY